MRPTRSLLRGRRSTFTAWRPDWRVSSSRPRPSKWSWPLSPPTAPTTRLLHPGEGGYDEALAEWDLQQHPDRAPVVSTASGRREAMALVHAVATSPDHAVGPAVAALDDPEASGEALRHVLVGGVHSVEAFAAEVAEAEG